jgi:hypothetical protein
MSSPEQQASIKPERGGNGGTIPPAGHRFKKGQSGNPGGRPKGSGVTGALRRLLEKAHDGRPIEELIAERWLKDALAGKPVPLQMLLERTEGKVTDKLDVNASGPLTIRVVYDEERTHGQ